MLRQASGQHGFEQCLGHAVGLAFGTRHIQLGGGVAGGQGQQNSIGIGRAAQDLQQATTRIGAIVKAKPTLFEKDVTAHLPAQRRVDLFHFGFDQRMPGAVHQRLTPGRANGWGQPLRAFHVINDGASGHAREHILGKQLHLPIGVNVLAIAGDDAQAVTIAIEGQAQLCARAGQSGDQILQVFRFAGIGVVVGKLPINLAEQLNDLAAQGAKDTGRRRTGHAVATVNHDFHGPRQAHIANDAVAVWFDDVHQAHLTARFEDPAFIGHGGAQSLDVLAIDGAPGQDHFETVVILGVVAARDLNAAAAQRVRGKVQHRGGDHPHVNHHHAHIDQTLHQGRAEAGRTPAAVTAHGHRGLPTSRSLVAKGTAQSTGKVGVQGIGYQAPDVIGFEGVGVGFHGRDCKRQACPTSGLHTLCNQT